MEPVHTKDIYLYNTLTRSVDLFIPNKKGEVSIYTCGPTVYNYAHIGNLRTYVSEDILEKTFLSAGYHVKRVMNITDVGHLTDDGDAGNDKMLTGAKRENKTVWEIASFYTEAFFQDCAKLNIKKPDIVPRATDFITEYISFIEELEKKGYAYFSNGNVYFDISKFEDYTRLSRMDLSELVTAHRDDVDPDTHKRNPQDFVLWFTRSKFEDQAMKWHSPWGEGYPGWHIECSVISLSTIGKKLDIHCGGVDHIPVHHTNEIAQTESFTGEKWCNYWWHAEFLLTDSSKMSKSSGEFLTVSLLEEKGYSPLVYRFYLLGSHYRKQLSFSFENLEMAKSAYQKLTSRTSALMKTPPALTLSDAAQRHLDNFYGFLYHDLGTPNALTEVYNILKSDLTDNEKSALLYKVDEILSLNLHLESSMTADRNSASAFTEEETEEIQKLIAERTRAKAEKNWSRADEIRSILKERGIELIDSKEGTTFRKG